MKKLLKICKKVLKFSRIYKQVPGAGPTGQTPLGQPDPVRCGAVRPTDRPTPSASSSPLCSRDTAVACVVAGEPWPAPAVSAAMATTKMTASLASTILPRRFDPTPLCLSRATKS